MITTYKSLSEQLELNDEKQLNTLRDWCHNHISSDIEYDGDDAYQYALYKLLAQNYLDNFSSNNPSLDGLTAFQYASFHGYDHYLIKEIPNLSSEIINQPNASGMTPLHLAAAGGHPSIVSFLLQQGANPTAKNDQNQLPMYSALQMPAIAPDNLASKKETIFRALNKAAPGYLAHQDNHDENVFHLMASNGFATLLAEGMVEESDAIFQQNSEGQYPIHIAILNNDIAIINLLIQMPGVAKQIDASKKTLLHYAASNGSRNILEQCWTAAPEGLNALDRNHKTPIQLAMQSNNMEGIKFFMEHAKKKAVAPQAFNKQGNN